MITPRFIVIQDGKEVIIDRERCGWPTFTEEEYRRRWQAVHEFMERESLDCLLVSGGEMHWGKGWSHIRWLTNYYGATDPLAFVLVPRGRDPIVITWYYHPAILAQNVVDDIRFAASPGPMAVKVIRELGLERGTIGLVEHDIHLPRTAWDPLNRELPNARLRIVTEPFMLVRWQKSPAEIECLKEAARIGDAAMREMARSVRPGMTEHELWGVVYKSIYDNGGEPGMVLLSRDTPARPVRAPAIHPQTKVPMYHEIEVGDLLVAEIGPLYRGYEAQTGKPMTLGPAPDHLKRLFELCADADRRIARALEVGLGQSDVMRPEVVGSEIWDRVSDGRMKVTLHGMYGAALPDGPIWRLGPSVISSEHTGTLQGAAVRSNTVWSIEIWARDHLMGPVMFLADTFLVSESGAKRLSAIAPQLFTIDI